MFSPLRSARGISILTLCAIFLFVAQVAAAADEPAEVAADWIAQELDQPEPSFDLFGKAAARADVIFALASVGGHEDSVRQALGELAEGANAYIGTPDDPLYVGNLAKVLLAVRIGGEHPASFVPGRDLEQDLRTTINPDGSFVADNYAHSVAMLALAAGPGEIPSQATAWLVDAQNDDGSWSSAFAPDDPDVDTTAIAVQALVAAGSDAASEGASYLVGVQNADGSWPSPFGDPNTNTAGVAGQALRAAGETGAADLAAGFVTSLQTESGGIKFVATDTEPNGFATLQGVLALGGAAYHQLETQPYADVGWDDLFAEEIDWMGDSGISLGCNPPTNNRYCPNDPVTRGQMAAFLHRALGDTLPTGDTTDFTDDNASIFEADIEWASATGITQGCNPPTNDQYCPNDPVTRGQMAAFLFRALGG